MIKPEPPCRDCEKRVAGCHGTCEEYLNYTKNQEAYKKAVRHEDPGIIYPEGQLKKMRRERKK